MRIINGIVYSANNIFAEFDDEKLRNVLYIKEEAVSSVIQQMFKWNTPDGRGEYILTESLPQNDRMNNNDRESSFTLKGYKAFVPSRKIDGPPDCLNFAEMLAARNSAYHGKECMLQEIQSEKEFGKDYILNREIARENRQDEEATPNIGEAYAIVRMYGAVKKTYIENGKEKYPYHIATVIFRDGPSSITLEAFADTENKYPVF